MPRKPFDPKKLSQSLERQKKSLLKTLTASYIAEHEARRLNILTELLLSKEVSSSVRDGVSQRLNISPDEVTAYHGIILRAVIEAQNGNMQASKFLRDESATLQEHLALFRTQAKPENLLDSFSLSFVTSLAKPEEQEDIKRMLRKQIQDAEIEDADVEE